MESRNQIWNHLDELKKNEKFSVPTNYFEKMSINVQEKITSENKPEEIPNIWTILKPALSLTLFVGIFALIIRFGLLLIPSNYSTKEDMLSDNDEMLYNQFHLIDWDDYENTSQSDSTYQSELDDYIIAYGGDLDFIIED